MTLAIAALFALATAPEIAITVRARASSPVSFSQSR